MSVNGGGDGGGGGDGNGGGGDDCGNSGGGGELITVEIRGKKLSNWTCSCIILLHSGPDYLFVCLFVAD